MDMQKMMGQLLSAESIRGLSQKTGASQKEVKSVIGAALPTLLGGAQQQADGKETAAGFAGALTQHAAKNTGDLGAFFKGVDIGDGAKIVGHLLGSNAKDETAEVSRKSGVGNAKTALILAAAAPLLMSLLGQQAKEEEKEEDVKDTLVSGLMGSLLGGGKTDVAGLALNLLGGLGDDDDEDEKEKEKDKKKKKGKKDSKKDEKEEEKDDGLDLGDVASLLTGLLK